MLLNVQRSRALLSVGAGLLTLPMVNPSCLELLYKIVPTLTLSCVGCRCKLNIWGSCEYHGISYLTANLFLKVGEGGFWWHFRVTSLLLHIYSPNFCFVYCSSVWGTLLPVTVYIFNPKCVQWSGFVHCRIWHRWTTDLVFQGCVCCSRFIKTRCTEHES